MTYRIYTPLLVGTLILFCALPVFAQTAAVETTTTIETGTPGNPPLKPLDAIKARAQELKNTAPGERKEALKQTLEEGRDATRARIASTTAMARTLKDAALMHGGVIKNRFRLAIGHLNNILDRTAARLDKMAGGGVDTSAVKSLHAEATSAVEKAEADAKAIADYVDTITDASDRATVRAELQAKIKTAHASLKEAHTAVRETVTALVALAKAQKPEAGADASVDTSVTGETNIQ